MTTSLKKCYGGPFHGQTMELEDGPTEWELVHNGQTYVYRRGLDGQAWLPGSAGGEG